MKVRVATLASVSALLVTVSAAAMVNAVVLGNVAPQQASAAPLPSSDATTTVASSVVPADAQLVTDTVPASVATELPTTQPAATTATTAAPVRTTAVPVTAAQRSEVSYSVGRAGSVVLRASGGRLTVVRISPKSNWRITRSSATATKVSVTFRSGSTYVVFKASLLYGVVSVATDQYTTPTSVPPTTSPTRTTAPGTTTTQPPAPTTTQPWCSDDCDDD